MQPDRRLVEHIQDAPQLGADLRRQPDALRLAARKRGRRAVQAQSSPGRPRAEIPAARRISSTTRPAICISRSANSHLRTVISARAIGRAVNSAIDMPLTRTARLAGRSRLPWHAGHSVGRHVLREPLAVVLRRRLRRFRLRILQNARESVSALPARHPAAGSESCGKSSNGVVRLMPMLRPAPRSAAACTAKPSPVRGRRPSSGFDRSAMTFAGSNVHLLPSPWHSSHAPYGLLNENERGSSCGTLVPHSVQASFCE